MDISHLKFIANKGDGVTTACLMSARSLLDGRPFGDSHPSGVTRRIAIRINDGPWWDSDEERTATLLPLALDDRLCASKMDDSPAAERERARLCADWALSWAAPFALEGAAKKMRDPDRADELKRLAVKLRTEPTKANARSVANSAAAVVYAAYPAAAAAVADAADAVYAAAADDAAYPAAVAAAYDRKTVRDSLIALFLRLLDVGAK